jgi:carbamoylphosphate synthase small subunit
MQIILQNRLRVVPIYDIFKSDALREVQGEVVFTTGMIGYVETLTDPSYRGTGSGNHPHATGQLRRSGRSIREFTISGTGIDRSSTLPSPIPSHLTTQPRLLQSQGIPAIEGMP